jgi:phage FluMu gp28-like protein
VIAVPGKPDTVRGCSANILLTEFAFFEDPDKTWRAILPSITNPLRGGLKKCRLVTTPNGVGNKAHDLWLKNYQQPNSKWSCHRIDIYDAVKQGLPVDIEELKAALDDLEGWAQEYELNFLDQATVLLPYDLIVPCENPLATATCDPSFWAPTSGGAPIFLGIDFGRSRDLTVCWAVELIGGTFRMTKEVLELRKMSTPDQLDILRPRIRRAQHVCLDYTGPGVGLGDLMVAPKEGFSQWKPEEHKFGKVELCTFTNKLKLEIFPSLRVAFEQKTIGIPVNRVIRDDLHSMSRVALAGGGVTYRAPHTVDGHADRCTGLALAIRAGKQPGMNFSATLI